MMNKKSIVSKKEFEKLFPGLIPLTDTTGKIKKPVYKIKCPLESSEAKTFWAWAQYHPVAKHYLFAIPNGGSRNPREAKNMQAQGVRPGISDYFLAHPSQGKAGMFLELKRANRSISRLTEEQAIWLAQCERVGYHTRVCYGADEAIRAVEEYLK